LVTISILKIQYSLVWNKDYAYNCKHDIIGTWKFNLTLTKTFNSVSNIIQQLIKQKFSFYIKKEEKILKCWLIISYTLVILL
jgi:predicted secreted Zn-dependent protease